MRLRVVEIQKALVSGTGKGKFDNIISPSRLLVHEGYVYKVNSTLGTSSRVKLFLFTDMLIYAEDSSDEKTASRSGLSGKLFYTRRAKPQAERTKPADMKPTFLETSDEKYRYRRRIYLSSSWILSPPDTKFINNVFQIVNPIFKNITFIAESAEEKNIWVRLIETMIKETMEFPGVLAMRQDVVKIISQRTGFRLHADGRETTNWALDNNESK
jgi:hypothetical protein